MQPGLLKEELPTSTTQADVVTENLEVKKEEVEKPTNEEKEIEPKDITDRMDLEKQQDLFKAVFMSSDSESENEDDDNKKSPEVKTEESRKEELKSAVLSDQLIPKIKPMKEGVLSGINFHKFSKPVPKSENKDSSGSEKVDDPNCYGPKIPEKIPAQLKLDITCVSSESDDEWIEKGASDSKKKKKHKKEKKHKKDKHRKHKHEKKNKYKE